MTWPQKNPDGTINWGPIPDEHEDRSTRAGRDVDGKQVSDDASRAAVIRLMSYQESWGVDRVLAPVADQSGLFVTMFDRGRYAIDHGYRAGTRRRFPELEAYYANFRLTFRAEGNVPGFIDSTGAAHPFPEGVTQARSLRIEAVEHHAFGADVFEFEPWLTFHDATGRTLLLLPGYGWEEDYQLGPFAKAAGWEYVRGGFRPGNVVHEFMQDLEPQFPGIMTCPAAPVGGPLSTNRPGITAGRFR